MTQSNNPTNKTPLFVVKSNQKMWHLVGPDGGPLGIGPFGCTAPTRRDAIEEAARRVETDSGYYWTGQQITDTLMFKWQSANR